VAPSAEEIEKQTTWKTAAAAAGRTERQCNAGGDKSQSLAKAVGEDSDDRTERAPEQQQTETTMDPETCTSIDRWSTIPATTTTQQIRPFSPLRGGIGAGSSPLSDVQTRTETHPSQTQRNVVKTVHIKHGGGKRRWIAGPFPRQMSTTNEYGSSTKPNETLREAVAAAAAVAATAAVAVAGAAGRGEDETRRDTGGGRLCEST
jgi:hypothetical protein